MSQLWPAGRAPGHAARLPCPHPAARRARRRRGSTTNCTAGLRPEGGHGCARWHVGAARQPCLALRVRTRRTRVPPVACNVACKFILLSRCRNPSFMLSEAEKFVGRDRSGDRRWLQRRWHHAAPTEDTPACLACRWHSRSPSRHLDSVLHTLSAALAPSPLHSETPRRQGERGKASAP